MIEILKSGLLGMKKDLKDGNIKKQIANMLTLSRLFSPFILLPLYYLDKHTLFIIMIIIFCLTDTFDGFFSRRYHAISLFGKYLDAFVDKVFVATLLIPILSGYLYLIFILEFLITVVNLYEFYKKLNPKTKYIGKIKTTVLFILIGLLYLRKFLIFNDNIILVATIITIGLQIITLISYIMVLKKDKFSKL